MDKTVRVVTELQLRREALELDRTMLVARLQLRCEHGAEGLDARTLRDWENRSHTPSALYQELLCVYFQVDSIAELGLGATLKAARYWTWRPKPERKREVRRRQLLRVPVSVAAVSLFPVSPLVAAAQILGGYRRLDAIDLDTARQVVTHLAASYAETPDQDALGAAQAHAYTLLDLLKRTSMTPDQRTLLAALASDATSLAGYAELNAGRYTQADRWFATALRLARDAEDRRLEAHALASRAWIFVDGPAPDRAAAIAALEAAAELQGALPPAGRAWLLGYLTDQGAAAGDDLASGRLLERARIAAAAIPRHDPGWGCWSTHGELSGWDGARADVFAGARSLRLGRPAEAVELLEGALDGTTRPVRRAAVYETLTEAGVALGDPDRTCASATAALDETPGLGLGLGIDTIRKIRKTFPHQWTTLPPIIDLDERLHPTA